MKKLITLLLSVTLTLACVFATGCTNFSASYKNEVENKDQLTKLFEDNKADFENLFAVVDEKNNSTVVGLSLEENLDVSLKSDSIKVKLSEDANLNVNITSEKAEVEPAGNDEDKLPNGNVEANGKIDMNLEVKGDYFKLPDELDEENPVYANPFQLAGNALYGKSSLNGKVYFDKDSNLFLKGSMNLRDMLESKGQFKVNVGKALGYEQNQIADMAFERINLLSFIDAEMVAEGCDTAIKNRSFKVLYNDKKGLKLKITAGENINEVANEVIDKKLAKMFDDEEIYNDQGDLVIKKRSNLEVKELSLYIVFGKDGKLEGVKLDVNVKGSIKVEVAPEKTEDVKVKVKGSATLKTQTDKVKKVSGAKDYVDLTATLVNMPEED